MSEQFLLACHEIVEFCKKHRGKCFAGWSDEILLRYVAFHAFCGTLFLVRVNDKITAIAVAQPMSEAQLSEPFAWQKTDGDCILFHELIGSRREFKTLFCAALNRFPQVKRYFGQRFKGGESPVLLEFKPPFLERFAH